MLDSRNGIVIFNSELGRLWGGEVITERLGDQRLKVQVWESKRLATCSS